MSGLTSSSAALPARVLGDVWVGVGAAAVLGTGGRCAGSLAGGVGRRPRHRPDQAPALSAASTIILGLQSLNTWASLAFALVALGTLLGAVEPFFNWRSRWVLMEETQYRFQRLADDLEYLVASTAPEELTYAQLGQIFNRYQIIWDDLSRAWLEHRREPAQSTNG
ncbi:SLATT domain-containing protein [Streptomyces globisporus]|uniref:SLATT domain-containing protein n=1 Tax=Streptomyces globisporus TaxID=1908 RepID=UPI003664B96C